jgi:hypothetical protein
MSGWGSDMSGFAYWNPARKPDMSRFSGEIGSNELFDDLHFTNAPNAPLDITELLGHK